MNLLTRRDIGKDVLVCPIMLRSRGSRDISFVAMDAVSSATEFGCFVRVTTHFSGGNDVTASYLVAAADANRAIEIVKRNVAKTGDEVVVVSRVSGELMGVLGLPPGSVMRADGRPLETVVRTGNGLERSAFTGLNIMPQP
jgi:hypothetical protein